MECCLNFFMNFLNIEKNKIIYIFFQYFKFSSRFMLFPTLKNKKAISNIKKTKDKTILF